MNGAVGGDGQPVLGVCYRVAPLLSILYSQRKAWILHSSQHIQKRSLDTGARGVFARSTVLGHQEPNVQARTETCRPFRRYLQCDGPHHVWVCVA